jgi:hypothetical protein
MCSFSTPEPQEVFRTIREIGGNAQGPVAGDMAFDCSADSSGRIILDPVLQVPTVLHEVVEVVLELD